MEKRMLRFNFSLEGKAGFFIYYNFKDDPSFYGGVRAGGEMDLYAKFKETLSRYSSHPCHINELKRNFPIKVRWVLEGMKERHNVKLKKR